MQPRLLGSLERARRTTKVVRSGLTITAICCLVLFLAAPAVAAAPQTYAVTDIGDLSQTCPFDGSLSDLPNLSGATALNNVGQVVGWAQYYCRNDLTFQAVKWNQGTLAKLGGLYGGFDSAALAINDAGTAVGWSNIAPLLGHDAVLFGANNIDIGALAYGGPWCMGFATCAIDAWSEATNINDQGEVVGESMITPQDPLMVLHPFYYFNGKLYDNQTGLLGGPQRTIGTNAWGQTVSGRTVPVGWFIPSGDPTLTQDGVVTHLNSVIPSSSGLTLIDAADINDHGQIAGTASATDCIPGAGCTFATHMYLLTDESPPSCTVAGSGTNAEGESYVTFAVQDTLSGLKSTSAATLTNATTALPTWNVGTPRQVVATVTKTNQSKGSLVELQATDIAGNVVNCDPTLMISRATWAPEAQAVGGLTADQHVVTVTNGTPGIENMMIAVDDHTVQQLHLGSGQTQTIDVAAYMSSRATNVVAVRTSGKPGGSALVVISDS